MSSPAPQHSVGYLRAALSLKADGASAEVVSALRAEGVRSIILKGPALAEWLYADGAERSYVDTDLLVDPEQLHVAQGVLEAKGFSLQPELLPPVGEAVHAEPYFRDRDGAAVDLHRTLFGCGVPPARVWPAVSASTVPLWIAGVELEAPRLEVRALIVVLHAAQHGAEAGKPVEDLRRALGLADREVWERAAALAREFHAELPFATGLVLSPGGRELARDLGLIDPDVAHAALGGVGPLVLGLGRVAGARGARAKARLLAREVFPPPEEIRWREQSEGRPGHPLWRAYVRRLARLVRQLPSSLGALRRAYLAGAVTGSGPPRTGARDTESEAGASSASGTPEN